MGDDPYLVGALVQGWKVLAAFQGRGEALRLRDIVDRTGIGKGTTYRLLYTLRRLGFIEKTGDNEYRSLLELPHKKKYRIGYAMNGLDIGFTRVVNESLVQAAQRAELELLVVDNRNDSAATLRNATWLVREKVDLAIEFQGEASIAHAISATFLEASIPMIAVDVPHPGATYFGANNYQAGLMAGRFMGKWARTHWQGQVDELLLLDFGRAGPLPQARITGILAGLNEVLRSSDIGNVTRLDGDGNFGASLDAVRKHLRHVGARRTLIGAVNDAGALAAMRAFEEAGREPFCAAMGENAEPDARAELRRPNTRLIGSVAYFPEKYGENIVRLAISILDRAHAPPAVFTRHTLVTPENVDRIYPNDYLAPPGRQ